jgi:hypothetical protein
MASDVEAGRAYVKITANDAAALKAVDRFGKRFTTMGKTISGVGAKMGGSVASSVSGMASAMGIQRLAADAVVAGMIGAGVAWSNAASDAVDMADRVGTSVEAVTGLSYAAEQSGASAEALEKGLSRMQMTLGQAAAGSDAAAGALGDLGLRAEDLQGLSVEDQFRAIADKLAAIRDPAEQAAAGARIFGKGFKTLRPLLDGGSAGIDTLVARAKHLGLVLGSDDARAAEAFGDGLADLKKSIMGNVYAIGAALVPILSAAAGWITEAAASVSRFLRENREMIKVVFLVFSAVTAAGVGLWAFGAVLGLVGSALALIGPLIAAAKIAIVAMGSALAFLVSPIGIAIAALVAIGTYLVMTTTNGAAMLDWFGAKFAQLATDCKDAWGGISNALAAGDLGLAARIAFSFVALEAAKAWRTVWEIWYGFKDWFIGLFSDAWFGAVIVAGNAIASLETWWAEGVGYLGQMWDDFCWAFRVGWNEATGWITKQWSKVMSLISDDVNVEAEIERIDKETNAANVAADQGGAGRADERVRIKDERLKQIEQDRKDAEAGAVQLADEGDAKRRADSDAELAKMDADIEKGRGEFKALTAEAADKKAAADAAQAPDVKRPDPASLGDFMGKKQAETSVAGTFNAAAGFGFAKQAKPLEQIVDELKRANELLAQTAANTEEQDAFQ